jgi:hypothetical protein
MGFMRASIRRTDPVGQRLGGHEAHGLHDGAFPGDPRRGDEVQPGAFTGQPAGEHTDSASPLVDLAVVVASPGVHPLTGVPRGVVPHPQEGAHAARGQGLTAPGEHRGRERPDRLPHGEPPPEVRWGRGQRPHQQSITRQRGWIEGVWDAGVCAQPPSRIRGGPGVPGRLGQAAPPDVSRTPHGPVGVGRREADEAGALVVVRRSAGSGLVLPWLARFQRVVRAAQAWRLVSPLTGRGGRPSAQATSAASGHVHPRVGLPQVRGRWGRRVRSGSRRRASKTACGVRGGADDPRRQVASPCVVQAWMALRTV